MIVGIGASTGIAIGKAIVISDEAYAIELTNIENIDSEISKFKNAIDKTRCQIEELRDKVLGEMGSDKAEIIEAQLMILEDPEIVESTINRVINDKINCDYVLNEVINKYVDIFSSMDNEYIRERIADVKDVGERLIKNILGIEINTSHLNSDSIVVAGDLTPSQFAALDKSRLIGVITEFGGKTSHTAIMARTLGIPALVGAKDTLSKINNDDMLILDGDSGKVIVNPDQAVLNEYMQKLALKMSEQALLKNLKGVPTSTKDGKRIELVGNIGTSSDIDNLLKNDAEGVGLFRTEFVFMNRNSFPSEEEQYIEYKKVLEAMTPKPIVIRTLDIGGDKELSYLNIGKELNPFLGYRAIRLCLDQVDIFKTQLRALLRASVYGNLRIMFPMISSLEELIKAKNILTEVKDELAVEGIEYSNDIEVGMMIEVPSAAIISDVLAKHVDFFSIGTNDLTQYTCAVDRMNEKIQDLYSNFNPGVLRLIKLTIDNGHKEGIWVGMCGEMAGDIRAIPLLLGLGLDELSMSPSAILKARKYILDNTMDDMKVFADKIMTCKTSKEVMENL